MFLPVQLARPPLINLMPAGVKKKKTTASVVVLDVGKGMDGGPEGATYLEQATDAVMNLVEQKVLLFSSFSHFARL